MKSKAVENSHRPMLVPKWVPVYWVWRGMVVLAATSVAVVVSTVVVWFLLTGSLHHADDVACEARHQGSLDTAQGIRDGGEDFPDSPSVREGLHKIARRIELRADRRAARCND